MPCKICHYRFSRIRPEGTYVADVTGALGGTGVHAKCAKKAEKHKEMNKFLLEEYKQMVEDTLKEE